MDLARCLPIVASCSSVEMRLVVAASEISPFLKGWPCDQDSEAQTMKRLGLLISHAGSQTKLISSVDLRLRILNFILDCRIALIRFLNFGCMLSNNSCGSQTMLVSTNSRGCSILQSSWGQSNWSQSSWSNLRSLHLILCCIVFFWVPEVLLRLQVSLANYGHHHHHPQTCVVMHLALLHPNQDPLENPLPLDTPFPLEKLLRQFFSHKAGLPFTSTLDISDVAD